MIMNYWSERSACTVLRHCRQNKVSSINSVMFSLSLSPRLTFLSKAKLQHTTLCVCFSSSSCAEPPVKEFTFNQLVSVAVKEYNMSTETDSMSIKFRDHFLHNGKVYVYAI